MENNKCIEVIEDSAFQELVCIICEESGIQMSGSLKIQAAYHLKQWFAQRGIFSFDDYCDYLFSKRGTKEEVTHMVSVITTVIGLVQ
ncbi:MAG: hypothetical protein KKA84_15575 [Bacteroidetes bacterium]|nr:hypothetical protein [Bacteroidota bacterium]